MKLPNRFFCQPRAGAVVVSALAACGGLLPLECRAAASSSSPAAEPSHVLSVNGRDGWIVTDDPAPRLTWAPATALPDVEAWRVVLDREDAPGERREWTIPAADGPLKVIEDLPRVSRARYRWQVTPLEGSSRTALEKAATGGRFEAGLLNAADWRGQWIGLNPVARERAAVWFRKGFLVEKPVTRARLYVSGLGWHETWLNGQKLGDSVLESAQTDYERRVFYVTHDVTAALRSGENALGVWVGDGWFNQNLASGEQGRSERQPRMIAQLEIVYTDNSTVIVASDGSWRAAPSAVTAANVYRGENFDSRRFDSAWASAGFDDAAWPAVRMVSAPGGSLVAEEVPPCRRGRGLQVRSWTEVKPGVHVADFGQIITGWARLRIRAFGPGTKVTLRYAESRDAFDTVDSLNAGATHRAQVQTDTYIYNSGGEEETWEPRFTYHVFQYVEFTAINGLLDWNQPGPRTLEGIFIEAGMPAASSSVPLQPAPKSSIGPEPKN